MSFTHFFFMHIFFQKCCSIVHKSATYPCPTYCCIRQYNKLMICAILDDFYWELCQFVYDQVEHPGLAKCHNTMENETNFTIAGVATWSREKQWGTHQQDTCFIPKSLGEMTLVFPYNLTLLPIHKFQCDNFCTWEQMLSSQFCYGCQLL